MHKSQNNVASRKEKREQSNVSVNKVQRDNSSSSQVTILANKSKWYKNRKDVSKQLERIANSIPKLILEKRMEQNK